MSLFGSADYIGGQGSAAGLLGMNPAQASRAAGASTPLTTAVHGDRQMVPWSADSPGFWVVVIAAVTVAGMLGADVRVRFLRGRGEASVGKT